MRRATSSALVWCLLVLLAAGGFADEADDTPRAPEKADPPDRTEAPEAPEAPDEPVVLPPAAAPFVPGRSFEGAKDWVRCLAFHPTSGILFAGSADRCLRLWDVTSGDLAREVRIPRRLGAVP